MADFMRHIIDVEIVSHRNSIIGRGNSASFRSIDTDTTNTSCISAAAGGTEHVADIVIRLADNIGQSRLQLPIPGTHGGVGICGRVVKNNRRRIRNQIEVQGQVFLITAVAASQRGVESSEDESDLTGVERAKKVGVLPVAGLGQTHGLDLSRVTFMHDVELGSYRISVM